MSHGRVQPSQSSTVAGAKSRHVERQDVEISELVPEREKTDEGSGWILHEQITAVHVEKRAIVCGHRTGGENRHSGE